MSDHKNMKGRKVAKQRISVLLGSNATGDFKTRPVVIGFSQTPNCMRNIMNQKKER